MLRSLHIENIAVVKCADIELGTGFSVLTGETGVGKSVIVDSLKLLSGSKVSRELVRSGEQGAVVEGLFDSLSEGAAERLGEIGITPDDGEILIRYTLSAEGKQTVRINGRQVTKGIAREVGQLLISIHGQNDSKVFFDRDSYVEMLDSFAKDQAELAEYRECYAELDEYRKRLRAVTEDDSSKQRERDMLEYQIKDIDAKKLKIGEEEALTAERSRLGDIERINKQVKFSYKILQGADKGGAAAYLLSRASASIGQLSGAIPEMTELSEKLLDLSYEVTDIAERIKEFEDDSDEDPTERIDRIESRLEAISGLKRRYGGSIEEILAFRKKAQERLDEIENSESLAEEYREKIKISEKKASEAAKLLTEKRNLAASQASEAVMEVLSFLDMPKVSFSVRVSERDDFCPTGRDHVEFMIATNPGEEPKPMASIASGGELSRIMLALKSVMNQKDGVGCSVYDEIDTGISGKTSRKIGLKLLDIAKESQVICVTHSAQIATLADSHFLISKEEIGGRSHTSVRLLHGEERVEEAARILGGINITEAQRQAARDMLER